MRARSAARGASVLTARLGGTLTVSRTLLHHAACQRQLCCYTNQIPARCPNPELSGPYDGNVVRTRPHLPLSSPSRPATVARTLAGWSCGHQMIATLQHATTGARDSKNPP